jgi:hypothetical protein
MNQPEITSAEALTPNSSQQSFPSKTTSFFEFWPTWVMYLPVVVQWIFLGLRHRSLTLPLLANPSISLGGMVGGSKDQLMAQSRGILREALLPWVHYIVTDQPLDIQMSKLSKILKQEDLTFPLVCKPDMGCRGAGVKLVKDLSQLKSVLAVYPENSAVICQQLASHELEVGIFYVRCPEDKAGKVVSLTLKHRPYVIGDGVCTLQSLVEKDPRACNLLHLYQPRNQQYWHSIIPVGEKFSLLFSASHCRGAVFEDGRHLITPELTTVINRMMQGLPDFYYGRLDVKYADIQSLQLGKRLEVIEINGASAESIHIWDKNTQWLDAIKTLLWQYRVLFKTGAYHRAQGLSTPSLKEFFQSWLKERRLTRYYPETD